MFLVHTSIPRTPSRQGQLHLSSLVPVADSSYNSLLSLRLATEANNKRFPDGLSGTPRVGREGSQVLTTSRWRFAAANASRSELQYL